MLPRGRKFVFTASNSRGTTYKWPLSAIAIDTVKDSSSVE